MNNRIITSNTKTFAVIGDPISHSLSPVIHSLFYNKLSLDRLYITLKIKEQELGNGIPFLRENFGGFNVTIPHKEEILQYLDEIDDEAKAYGAVNTVKITDGRLIGFNTDGYGFSKTLQLEGVDLRNKKVLILGAGGGARVVAFELIKMAAKVTIANRNLKRAEELKLDIEEANKGYKVKAIDIIKIQDAYDCIINTTPLGMGNLIDSIPIKEENLQGAEVVFDLIYNPYQTKLLKCAKTIGSKGINGLQMLFYQGIKAQEIWLDQKIDEEIIQSLYKEFVDYHKNQ
ncbi:shikimate dehydrogenase [Alkaliphilus serpentinus]|uniref:Shikimate dehydrogenase (NADP(+)) n=1 Tax=Alkaliphilus serpentinus TaxID=1482731 RepID=A0A833HLT7_9FIRM|nr:shikimate dehydrogenase [Alkaliphilus serpentinus]KAB3526742.1 shikimate dehydrogenase [Alkaliphilus serpentinus]